MGTIFAITSTTGPQSGKSTFADYAATTLAKNAVRMRFSDPLIDYLFTGFKKLLEAKGLSDRALDYEAAKNTELVPGITGRDVMIAAGEGMRDRLGKDFFARILEAQLPTNVDVIIDDLRKKAEIEMLDKFCAEHGLPLHIINVKHPIKQMNDTEFDEAILSDFVRDKKSEAKVAVASWKEGVAGYVFNHVSAGGGL